MKTRTQKTTEDRPEVLDKFGCQLTLVSLQQLAVVYRVQDFIAAQRWVEKQLQQRGGELQQIARNIRAELIAGDRAAVEKWVITKAVVIAETSELESLLKEIKLCAEPGRITGELARRDLQRGQIDARHRALIETGR